MDKLKRNIYRYGTLLGIGAGRVTFKWQNKAWKVPYNREGVLATQFEQVVFNYIVEYRPWLRDIFPNPTFLGNIIQSDVAEPIFHDILHKFDTTHLLEFFAMRDIEVDMEEILYTKNNLGVSGNKVKVLDWGMALTPHDIGLRRNSSLADFNKTVRRCRHGLD